MTSSVCPGRRSVPAKSRPFCHNCLPLILQAPSGDECARFCSTEHMSNTHGLAKVDREHARLLLPRRDRSRDAIRSIWPQNVAASQAFPKATSLVQCGVALDSKVCWQCALSRACDGRAGCQEVPDSKTIAYLFSTIRECGPRAFRLDTIVGLSSALLSTHMIC